MKSMILGGDDKLYVPMPGDEQKALLCALFDGVAHVVYLKHPFFPTDWVKKEYPEYGFLSDVERGVRERFAAEGAAERQKAAA
jgi:hypothetical protein